MSIEVSVLTENNTYELVNKPLRLFGHPSGNES